VELVQQGLRDLPDQRVIQVQLVRQVILDLRDQLVRRVILDLRDLLELQELLERGQQVPQDLRDLLDQQVGPQVLLDQRETLE